MLTFACVALQTTVLCEYSLEDSFSETIQTILKQKITGRLSFVYQNNCFHCYFAHPYLYICASNDSKGKRTAFLFLDELQLTFSLQFDSVEAIPFSMQSFSKQLKELLIKYNSVEMDKAVKVKGEMDEVKQVMLQNIDKVLERGDRIEVLIDKTSQMNEAAFRFRRRTRQVRRSMWWQEKRLVLGIGVLLIVLFYLIVCLGCGFPGWNQCFE